MPRSGMSAADSAWLGMAHRGGPMVVDAVLLLDGDLDAATVRALFRDRLLPRFPALSGRPARARGPLRHLTGMAGWVPAGPPDLDAVIGEVHLPSPMTREALQDTASALVSATMDPWMTPWRVDVLRGPGGSGAQGAVTALVFRLHHSIGDGVALVSVLDALLDPLPDGVREPPRTPPPSLRPAWRAALVALASALTVVPAFLGIVANATGRRLPLRDSAEGTQVAWSSPHDLAELKATAQGCGASLNDVLLAAVAGGLRQFLQRRGEAAADARVIVPVDLRPPGVPVDARLGNHIGVLFVPLPVSVDDPTARVVAVHTRTRRLKRSLQPGSTSLLLQVVGLLPRPLQWAAGQLLGRSADAVVTNVPGPTFERHLGGRRVRSVVFWVPRVGSITLGVSVFSYAGTVSVGVVSTTAPGRAGDLRGGRAGELLAAVDAELLALARAGAHPGQAGGRRIVSGP